MSYHELGRVAQARQQLDEAEDWLDEAEDWYRKCLITKEELGDKRGLASTYHHLGIVAQIRERLDEAEDWYRNSLTTEGSSKPAGDRPQLPPVWCGGLLARTVGRSRGVVPQVLEDQRATEEPPPGFAGGFFRRARGP